MQNQLDKLERILRQPRVIEITGLPKSTLWKEIKDGNFPQPIRLTKRSIGWFESDIKSYLERLRSEPWIPRETRQVMRERANARAAVTATGESERRSAGRGQRR
jgi:prophage regulatory protein